MGDDDFGGFSSRSAKDWEEYFKAIFKKVTEEDIISFTKNYQHSKEEQEDLKQSYQKFKGDLEMISECMMCSSEEDIPRFVESIDKYIAKGLLPNFPKWEKSKKEFLKSSPKRKKDIESEALEAEQLSKKIKGKENGKVDINSNPQALQKAIKTKQQMQMDSLVANLEAKYGQKGKRATKKSHEEPSEEEFQKARQRLEAKRK